MPMGYGAAFAEVIEEESLKKFVKNELEIFLACVNGCELDLEEFARNAQMNELEGYDKDLLDAYKCLCDAFEKKTGLTLGLGCHNSDDNGDAYDEVSGVYWNVDGMYQLTKAGKKIGDVVQRKFFVHFG